MNSTQDRDQQGNAKNKNATADELAGTEERAKNPNPRANENIRVRSDEPDPGKDTDAMDKVGSEITDGEDG